MIENLKSWLIKKLGGYTEGEHINLKGENLGLRIQQTTKEAVKLRVIYTYPEPEYEQREAHKRALARVKVGLEDAVLPYMRIRTTTDDNAKSVTVEGTLRVLKKEVEAEDAQAIHTDFL